MRIGAMFLGDVIFAAPDWAWQAGVLAALATGALVWSYWRSGSAGWAAVAAAALKGMGLAALIVCLVEPLFSGSRPRPQSNLFLLAADNSRSLEIHDPGNRRTRGETMQRQLAEKAGWRTRLAQELAGDIARRVLLRTHAGELGERLRLFRSQHVLDECRS